MKQFWISVFSLAILLSCLGHISSPAYADNHGLPPAPPALPGATPPPPPPPPPPPQQLKVFYTVNGQTLGPFNEEQLKAKIVAGELGRQTLVWMEGMTDWQAAATVAAVAPLLTTAPPKPKFDAAGFMVGTWEVSTTIPIQGHGQAQVSESITYRADGTATGFGTMTSQTTYGPFSVAISSQGTWKAEPKTDTSFVLTPNMQVTMTGADGIPNLSTNNTPGLLTVIDRNTVSAVGGTRIYRVGN